MPIGDNEDRAFGDVRDDVVNRLRGIFEGDGDDAFDVPEVLRGAEVVGNDTIVAVPWVFRCRQVGLFQGVFPTTRPLEIHGTTFVDRRGDEPMLHRYIDWAGVYNQLGLSVSVRVPVGEDEYREGRRILRGDGPAPS